MTEFRLRWHVYSDLDQLIEAVANGIVREAARAISATGKFLIVLAGGSTPQPIYARLVDLDTLWNQWHIYFGDERCLPIGDSGRNDTMAMTSWLDHVDIPAAQIHSIAAHLGADVATGEYARVLAGIFKFDLVLLGLGEDGHTASLFPGHSLGLETEEKTLLAVHDAPKPTRRRITLGAHRLSQANDVFFLIAGESKQQAVRNWRAGADIPARHITPADGIDVFLTANSVPEEELRNADSLCIPKHQPGSRGLS